AWPPKTIANAQPTSSQSSSPKPDSVLSVIIPPPSLPHQMALTCASSPAPARSCVHANKPPRMTTPNLYPLPSTLYPLHSPLSPLASLLHSKNPAATATCSVMTAL